MRAGGMSGSTNTVGVASAAGGGAIGGGGGGGPCGACKFLRRKCVSGCIFAPYFDSEQGAARFAAVHKVFGASNVSKLLLHIPAHKRLDAVVTVCYEAQARLRDPVYGCVAHIFALQQQVVNLQTELSYLRAHLATLEQPPQLPPPPQPPRPPSPPPPFSISDLPPASSLPASFDLSTLFDAPAHPSWPLQQQEEQQQMELRQLSADGDGALPETTPGCGDLQALAREFVEGHRPAFAETPPPMSQVTTDSSLS